MTNVVFTTIEALADIDAAKWRLGDNDSYEHTKRMIPDSDGLRLIGRQDKYGRVQLCYAASRQQGWTEVGAWHATLVRFFETKFAQRPEGDVLRVFFDSIDDEQAKNAAQQLIALECGINVSKEPWGKLHDAVLRVQVSLRALGLSCGDWTFVPMFNSFETAAHSTC